MSTRQAELLLAAVISARATACLFGKLLLETMPVFSLMAVRFGISFVLLVPICAHAFKGAGKTAWKHGIIIGVLWFVIMALETMALSLTASSSVAFLENTAIVLVPLFEAALARRLPDARTTISSIVMLAGVGMLTIGTTGLTIGPGEALAMATAVFYALAIMATARFSRISNTTVLGVLQIGVIGLLSTGATFAFETPTLPVDGISWVFMGVLIVVCTGFGLTLQPVAQRYVSAERAGLMCALNPLIAGILGIAFLNEKATVLSIAGMALIGTGIVFTSLPTRQTEAARKNSLDLTPSE